MHLALISLIATEGIPSDAGSITLKIKRVKILDAEWARPLPKLPSPALGKRKRGDASIQYVFLVILGSYLLFLAM